MTDLGAVFLPQLPPERLRPVVQAADEAGLDQLWLWEDCFYESGIATAAAALAWTGRLCIGVGLLPVPLRNVAICAMEVATLHRLFPERVLIAVGHGVQEWMSQVGARAPSPLTLLEEYVIALRSLLAGEQVTTSCRYVHLDRVGLHWSPPRVTKVFAGATGPRSLRLCGRLADGTILTGGTGPSGVARARGLLDEGRAESGRTDPHPIVVYLLAATGPGAEDRIERQVRAFGYDTSEQVAVAGDARTVAEAVRTWAEAGADTVVLQPTADDPDPEGFIRFVAQDVRPLIG